MNMSVKNARSIQTVTITDCMLSLEEFIAVAKYGAKVEFAPEMIETVNANRKLLDKFLKEGRIIYGVTTGFGENVRYTISPEDANTLQENIVRTHSVAVGEPLDRELKQARAVMLMTILNDGKGHSGIRIETLDLIRQMLNLDIYPWAPGEGSVGYLGVEGHLAMAYIGEGKIYDHGELLPAAEVLAKYGLAPLKLSYKEDLSMLNGTITVTAMALLALYEGVITMQNAEIAGAPSNETLIGQIFDGTKYKVAYEPNMEDYLLCHAAFVLPVAFACYKVDGDLKKLKGNTAYLNRLIDANIEGYRAIKNARHEILPKDDAEFEGAAYHKTCLRFFKLMSATSLGKICASDHAMNARSTK